MTQGIYTSVRARMKLARRTPLGPCEWCWAQTSRRQKLHLPVYQVRAARHLPDLDYQILFAASRPSLVNSVFTVGVVGSPFTDTEQRLDPAYVRELRRRLDTSWRTVRFWFRRRPAPAPVTTLASLLVAEGWPRQVVVAIVGAPRIRCGRVRTEPWRYVGAHVADLEWFIGLQLKRLMLRRRPTIDETISAIAPYCGVSKARAVAFLVCGVRLIARVRSMGLAHLLRKF